MKNSITVKMVSFSIFVYALVLICGVLWENAPLCSASDGGQYSPFPQITGWKKSGEIRIFLPKNLYDYIDGGADLYLKYDFQELQVAEYQDE